jgi:glycosyltransferase involved in cell wall biosynthesis
MKKPLVSILIPTYNREKLIAETIQSALGQDYDNLEVIVVDNASTDETWQRVQDIALSDSRVRAFRNHSNIGPVRNWIACAEKANGAFSKILWSDDIISSDYLRKTVPILADSEVGMVYTSAQIFKDPVKSPSKSLHYNKLPTGVYDSKVFIEGSLLNAGFPVSPGCFLLRTKDLVKNLLADIPNAVGSDFKKHAIGNDLLLLLLTANAYKKFGVVNEPLSLFRDHAGSISIKAGVGRLAIHYDIAKAYFVHRCKINQNLRRRFNSLLWIDTNRHKAHLYGIRCIQDFYPEPADTKISIPYLMQHILKRLARASRRLISGPFVWANAYLKLR